MPATHRPTDFAEALGWTLVLGNELLSRNNSQYVGGQSTENPGYSVAAVHAELRGTSPPLGWVGPEDMDGFDVWAGYLFLDAWVAGSASRSGDGARC